jgi:tRNA A-37 threonylcarbamoyl transferase component Bud32
VTDNLIGRTLRGGEYVLREIISHGGQATVYRAYARRLETDVAVKVLNQTLAADLAFRERFHDEARTLARLHHPNLEEVHWYGEEGELVYIVMRLVPGGTLKDRMLALGGSLGLTDTARMIGQIAAALQDAHDHGVLHLDVKPANVLLGRADWPLVADLGLTRAIQSEVTSGGHERVAGTPAYMSPEQCRGGAVDERSDQYSLAVTAYELLTGQQPFHAETTEALMQKHLESAPPRPRQINAGLPGPVEEVLLRGLAKEPGDRFPRIADFGQALSEAVERTRGVSLEAKLATAASAPNLLAILALVLAAPFMLAILPVGNVLGRLPLAWPFQLLLAGAIAALLLGVRWHLIGLVGRAVGGSLAILDRASRQQVRLGTGPGGMLHGEAWRHTARASAEGIVNLLYLLVTYRLVGIPSLAVARVLVDPVVYQLLNIASLTLVGAIALGIIVGIYRGGGAIPAALVLAAGWAAAIALPTFEVDLSGVATLALTAHIVVAAGLLLLLGAQRTQAADKLGTLASRTLGRLLIEGRPGITPEAAAGGKRQIERLAGNVLDFAYLLLGYALLRAPVVEFLSQLTTPLAAAIIATAVACLVWLVLIVRLHWTAGVLGGLLGVVLGAPVLVSLPLLDAGLFGVTLPATIATWIAAGAILLLLAALRGPTLALGKTAFGARLDRGLLGASAASSEEHSARRAAALGGIAGALIDVGFLLIGYWVIGVPATAALIRLTGEPAFGSVVLAGVLVLALLATLASLRHAATTLAETGGSQWRARARAFTVLALAAVASLVAVGGAAPVAIAGPSPVGAQGLTPAMTRVGPPTVVVDWDFWLPWTPRQEESTYNLSLRCSNGQPIGQFHEAFEPPAGQILPAGNAGQLGATSVPCDEWQQVYLARRHAAGLPDAASFSWEWVDIQASLNSDRTVDVVETQRVQFNVGRHKSLSWNMGDMGAAMSNLEVWEGDSAFPVVANGSLGEHYAQTWDNGGERWVSWSFPELSGPAVRTYTLKYRLAAGSASPDAATLFKQIVAAPERREPVWRTTVQVHVPDELAQTDLGLNASVAAAQTGRIDPRTLWFETSALAGGEGLSVAVNLPSTRPPDPTIQPSSNRTLADAVGASPAVSAPTVGPPASSPPVPTSTSTARPTAQVPAVASPTEGAGGSPTATSMPGAEVSATATIAPVLSDEPTATVEADPSSPPAQQDDTPAPTVTVSPSPSITPTSSPTATAPATPTVTYRSIVTATPTLMPTLSPTPTPTPTQHTSHGSSGSSDSTPPIITHTISPAPNILGWNNTPLTVSWSVSDPGSGIASSTGCAPIVVSTESGGLSELCTARNGAGQDTSDTVQVKLDMTAPVITHLLSPAPNAAGWNHSPVTVTWTISSPVSGIATTTGCSPVTVSTDTASTTLDCSATSAAGNSGSDAASVKLDTTSPRLDTTVTPAIAAAGQNVQIGVVASEVLSGSPVVSISGSCVATANVSMTPLASTYTGTYKVPTGAGDCSLAVTALATDLAGNVSVGSGAVLEIDRTSPTLAVNASPGLVRAGGSVAIEVLSSEPLSAPPVVAVTANCLSGSPIALSLAPAGQSDRYTTSFHVLAGSTDCAATIGADGADGVGNHGSGNTDFRIDRTPPRLSTDVSSGLGRVGTSIGITVAASEVLSSAPAVTITATCVPDDTVSTTLNGGVYLGTYTIPDGTTDCTANVQATGADLAGNPSVPTTGQALFNIKRSQPVLTTTASPSPARAATAVSITIDAGPQQLAGAPTVAVSGSCIQSSNVPATPAGAATSYTATYMVPEGSDDCTAQVSAHGFDAANNPSTGGAATFEIDRTPPDLRVSASPNPAQPAGSATVTVDASEDLSSAPTVTLAAATGCLSRDIHVSMSLSGQARSYSGTVNVPNIDGNCTARILASAEDLAHNPSTGGSGSLAIAQAMQVLRVSINSPISGSGNLVSEPGGISCVAGSSSQCSLTVARHESVRLFAQDDKEAVGFDTWAGSDTCSGGDPTCTVVMDKNQQEVANFLATGPVSASVGPTAVPTVVLNALASTTGTPGVATSVRTTVTPGPTISTPASPSPTTTVGTTASPSPTTNVVNPAASPSPTSGAAGSAATPAVSATAGVSSPPSASATPTATAAPTLVPTSVPTPQPLPTGTQPGQPPTSLPHA